VSYPALRTPEGTLLFADLAIYKAEQGDLRDAQHSVSAGHDFIGETGLANRYLGIREVGDGAIPQFAALEPLPLPVNRYDPPTWHGFTLEEVAHLREAFFSARLARAFFINDQNELGDRR
jgi:hypothetical protein